MGCQMKSGQAEYEKQNPPLSKEEVKDILKTRDPEALHKIVFFHLDQIDDIKWFFSEVETFMNSIQDENMLVTAGWALSTILTLNDVVVKQNDDIFQRARRFAEQLNQSKIEEMHEIAFNISLWLEFDLEEQ
nr:hypothetical protein [Bacillus altitudinis]